MTADPDDRRRDLARIHVLAKEIGLSRDDYEAILFTIARVHSAGDLDFSGRARVIEHLDALARRYRDAWIEKCSPERRPMLKKLMALAGRRGKRYVAGISKKMFGIERVEFCQPEQLHKIIAALVKDQQRRSAGR